MCSPQKVWRLINLHQVSSNKSNNFFWPSFRYFPRHETQFAFCNLQCSIQSHYNSHSISLQYFMHKVWTKPQTTSQNEKNNEEKDVLTIFRKTRFYITKFLPYPYTAMILLVGIRSHTTFIGFFQNIFWRRPIIFS